jgi:hypothetical protein
VYETEEKTIDIWSVQIGLDAPKFTRNPKHENPL